MPMTGRAKDSCRCASTRVMLNRICIRPFQLFLPSGIPHTLELRRSAANRGFTCCTLYGVVVSAAVVPTVSLYTPRRSGTRDINKFSLEDM
jgi:hypothetical protein